MSRRVLRIVVDCEDRHCGGCSRCSGVNGVYHCAVFCVGLTRTGGSPMRCTGCLAAESRATSQAGHIAPGFGLTGFSHA